MENIVITGASGWLGRATIRALVREFGISILDQIMAFGSSKRTIQLHGIGEIKILPLTDLVLLGKCENLFHFAFLTRDFLTNSNLSDYRESNDAIRETISSFVRQSNPKSLTFCSSGAVIQRSKKQEEDLSYTTYAELKLTEQKDLLEVATSCGTRTTVCTLFSATGVDMISPSKYAIGSLVHQALYGKQIQINSNGMVFRRYVDTEDLMVLLVKLAQESGNFEFESGGDLIELSELAILVNSIIGRKLDIIRPKFDRDSPIDDYYSKNDLMEKLFKDKGIPSKSLEMQIVNVIDAVKISNKRIR